MESIATRVYLVEDSTIIANLLTELLKTVGAIVIGRADTASRAIKEIAELRPDAVTLDISLKRGTGFDVLEALHNTRNRPLCIMLTNYTIDAYRQAAEQFNVDYFFDKARQIRELLNVIVSINKQDALVTQTENGQILNSPTMPSERDASIATSGACD